MIDEKMCMFKNTTGPLDETMRAIASFDGKCIKEKCVLFHELKKDCKIGVALDVIISIPDLAAKA